MNFMNKVCRVAYAHERAPRVNIVLPSIELFVALQGKKIPFILRLKQQAIWFKIGPFDIRDIG